MGGQLLYFVLQRGDGRVDVPLAQQVEGVLNVGNRHKTLKTGEVEAGGHNPDLSGLRTIIVTYDGYDVNERFRNLI